MLRIRDLPLDRKEKCNFEFQAFWKHLVPSGAIFGNLEPFGAIWCHRGGGRDVPSKATWIFFGRCIEEEGEDDEGAEPAAKKAKTN